MRMDRYQSSPPQGEPCMIRIVMPICDKNLSVLKISSYLFDFFWPEDTLIDVVGFKEPDFSISNKMNFISIAPEQAGAAASWSKYILKYLDGIDDQEVIFLLEDFLPTSSPNLNLIKQSQNLMRKMKSVGRFDLTFDSYITNDYSVLSKGEHINLIKKTKFAPYNVCTQPSIWNTNFLKSVLSNTTSPWNFEIEGNRKFGSKRDVLSFADPLFNHYPTTWIHKGSHSRHIGDKINLLGLPMDIIEKLIELNLVNEEDVIFGLWPNQKDFVGYSNNFHPSQIPLNEASRTQWTEYYKIYSKKPVFKIRDANFSRSMEFHGFDSCSDGRIPNNGFWNRSINNLENMIVYTDLFLNYASIKMDDSKLKVGLILEPRSIHPQVYENVLEIEEHLDFILTFDKKLLKRSDKYKKFTIGSSRLANDEMKIYEKQKMVSIIASKKRQTVGHKLRHEIVEGNFNLIDCYGTAYKRFKSKLEPLKDYMFSLCIMNSQEENFFTEVLLDCLLCGTVPIFWGCKNISDYFDTRGFIIVEDASQVSDILKNLKLSDYYERISFVEQNFAEAKKHLSTDDKIFKILGELL
jgi:hypothetical protein